MGERYQLIMEQTVAHNKRMVCPESCQRLTGASPVVVTARGPRSRPPVLSGDWKCCLSWRSGQGSGVSPQRMGREAADRTKATCFNCAGGFLVSVTQLGHGNRGTLHAEVRIDTSLLPHVVVSWCFTPRYGSQEPVFPMPNSPVKCSLK